MATSKKGNGRTIAEINQKIKTGNAQVLTAEEMKKLVESSGVEVAYKEVDVVKQEPSEPCALQEP